METIYSRSYGSIETDGKRTIQQNPSTGTAGTEASGKTAADRVSSGRMPAGITVPPDYHGSMYSSVRQYEPESAPPVTPVKEAPAPPPPPAQEKAVSAPPAPAGRTGLLGGLLEKISAEDILMFGLMLTMLSGDSDNNTALLAMILAIILT